MFYAKEKLGDSAYHNVNFSQATTTNRNIQFIEKYGKQGQVRAYSSALGHLTQVNYESSAYNILSFFGNIFKQIFLPVGYPDTVSDDYMEYQIWDTVQAFCSTITGTFTTHSVLKSVGVGNETATALGAAITWIIKDGSGMGGRILFAWYQGSSLDADCKYWRLFADVLNDIAMVIEFTLPYWELKTNMYALCLTSTMKSIVGVAGGATRAAITQHQAVADNMADVSAKDGSQETCVNLLASICGIFLLTSFENNEIYLGGIFLLLTFLHIFANYKAVRSLIFRNLNFTRFLIVFSSYLHYDTVATPVTVNKLETLFTGINQNVKLLYGFHIKLGCSFNTAFKTLSEQHFNTLKTAFKGKQYMIIPNFKNRTLYVGFTSKIDSEIIIKAHFHAVMLSIALCQYNNLILNVHTRRQLHHVTPLQRLNNFLKRFSRNQNPVLEMFSLQMFIEFNEFIKSELVSFFTALHINGWVFNRDSLKIGEWRYLDTLANNEEAVSCKKEN